MPPCVELGSVLDSNVRRAEGARASDATPSYHRVHHGKNVEYLDRTFEPERARVIYGLTKTSTRSHVIQAGIHELVAIANDLWRAPLYTEAML